MVWNLRLRVWSTSQLRTLETNSGILIGRTPYFKECSVQKDLDPKLS